MGDIRFRPLLALFVAASMTVMLIMSRGFNKGMEVYLVKLFVSILLVLGVVSMLLIILTRHQYSFTTEYSQQQQQQQPLLESSHEHESLPSNVSTTTSQIKTELDFYLSKYAIKLAIYIFGTISIGSNMLDFFTDLACLPAYISNAKSNGFSFWDFFFTNEKHPDKHVHYDFMNEISRLILTFTQVVFFMACIPFLVKMLKVKIRLHNCWTHSLILMIISASIGLWVYTFFRETGLLGVVPADDAHEVVDDFNLACSNHSTPFDIYKSSIEHVLYPFNMEFALACLELLLHVWFMNIVTHDGTHNDDNDPNYIHTTLHPPDNTQPVPLVLKIWGWILSLNNLNTAIFFGVLEVVAIKLFLIITDYLDDNHFDYITESTIEIYIECPTLMIRIFCNFVPAMIVTCHCYVIAKSFQVRRRGAHMLNATYVILGLSVVAVILVSVFDLIVMTFKFVSNDEDNTVGYSLASTLSVLESLLYTPQFILQAVLVYLCKTFISTERHQLHYTLEGLINYLAMFNFFRWGINSFLESSFKKKRIHLDGASSDMQDSWEALVHFCIPAVIYFHYLCTFLMLEIKYLIRFDKAPVETELAQSVRNQNEIGLVHHSQADSEPEAEYRAYRTSFVSATQPLIQREVHTPGTAYGTINVV